MDFIINKEPISQNFYLRLYILLFKLPQREQQDMEGTIEKRIAVVTGGNKGIGLEICRQLASNGVKVILTARDERRGIQAVEELKSESPGLQLDVIFHTLDVTDRSSAASLANFISTHFGKLDILVNNAAIAGVTMDLEMLNASRPAAQEQKEKDTGDVVQRMIKALQETYETAEECLNTNYYGTKVVLQALIPLLQSSNSGKIVNVSSTYGQLSHISSERIKQVLCNIDSLTEERLDELTKEFLDDFKVGSLESNGWPTSVAAYKVSKVLLNAYTRILSRKYPSLCINCVNPGFVKTDMNYNLGVLTVEEGAKGPVMLALLPDGSPSGLFFDQTKVSSF